MNIVWVESAILSSLGQSLVSEWYLVDFYFLQTVILIKINILSKYEYNNNIQFWRRNLNELMSTKYWGYRLVDVKIHKQLIEFAGSAFRKFGD